eukprot:3479339-Rhodomonas_salina.1
MGPWLWKHAAATNTQHLSYVRAGTDNTIADLSQETESLSTMRFGRSAKAVKNKCDAIGDARNCGVGY